MKLVHVGVAVEHPQVDRRRGTADRAADPSKPVAGRQTGEGYNQDDGYNYRYSDSIRLPVVAHQ